MIKLSKLLQDIFHNVDYSEVNVSRAARIFCLSVEVFGRWGQEVLNLVRATARECSAGLPAFDSYDVEKKKGVTTCRLPRPGELLRKAPVRIVRSDAALPQYLNV